MYINIFLANLLLGAIILHVNNQVASQKFNSNENSVVQLIMAEIQADMIDASLDDITLYENLLSNFRSLLILQPVGDRMFFLAQKLKESASLEYDKIVFFNYSYNCVPVWREQIIGLLGHEINNTHDFYNYQFNKFIPEVR